jgi:hypothetical protein
MGIRHQMTTAFPALKPNLGSCKCKKLSLSANSCDTMVDNTGHALVSTGKKHSSHDMLNASTVVATCGKVVG